MLPVARLHGSRGDEFALVSVVKGWQVRQGFIFVTVNGEPDNSNLSVSCAIRAGEVWVGSELRVLQPDCRQPDNEITDSDLMARRAGL